MIFSLCPFSRRWNCSFTKNMKSKIVQYTYYWRPLVLIKVISRTQPLMKKSIPRAFGFALERSGFARSNRISWGSFLPWEQAKRWDGTLNKTRTYSFKNPLLLLKENDLYVITSGLSLEFIYLLDMTGIFAIDKCIWW